MNRKIMFFPSFDRTDPDPKKNYGVGCLELRFLVIGEKGITEFQLITQWYQEHVMKRRLEALKKDVYSNNPDFLLRSFNDPYPADINYWSETRISEDDGYVKDGISYAFDKRPCFYGYKFRDETDQEARIVAYRKLVDEGDESLWKYLEDYYVEIFGELK